MNAPELSREGESQGHGPTLRDYFQLLGRRKWILLQALILVPAIAVALSTRQPARYQADAQVLLTSQSFAGLATNAQTQNATQLPDRTAATQADLARLPDVASNAIAAVPNAGLTEAQFLKASSVSAATNADLLDFFVTASTPRRAAELATAYARAYTTYRHELDTASLRRARTDVGTRLKELRGKGRAGSALANKLAETQQQLQTLETLQTSNATVVKTPAGAAQISPQPVRDAMLGVALGFILGLGLALLVDALDTRVRSDREVSERLGTPILGRLPEPPKKLRERSDLVMRHDPYGRQAEAFRMLRTNIELANIELEAKVIAVASALPAEGKSTTAANLAIAMARGGSRVALVDLDLRKPVLAEFFDPGAQWGVTDVALGRVALESAVLCVDVQAFLDEPNGTSHARRPQLDVLTAGRIPPNPGEFVSSRRLVAILGQLRANYDVVLVDTPPILTVGDALALSENVDAFILISNLKLTRRGELHELRRALVFARCDILGTVLTAADLTAGYGYGGGFYGYSATAPSSAKGRGEQRPANVER